MTAAAEVRSQLRTGERVTYGDPNQGEGHVVHIAHVGSARKNLEWARGLGLVP